MKISVLIGQFPITFNIYENLNQIKLILDKSEKDDLVVLPEGALSGYSDDVNFLKGVNINELKNGMNLLKEEVRSRNIHLIFGSCIFEEGVWYNAAICYSYNNPDFIYKKLNLAFHERGYFKQGNKLEVYTIKIGERNVKLGIQLCREIRFSEQWRWLAINKADIFVYLTNAVQGQGLSVWRSHLVSRAAENQRFLISSNNAHMNQHCPTMIIAPNGEILEEIVSDKLCCLKKEIELDEISDWYINQCRNDIIKLTKGERKGQLTLNSLYICVKDMDRAISFYEQFFEQQVDKNHDTFSIFNISGFRFCLFNNSKVNEDVTWGDNCLPSFEVNDMDNLIEKLKVLNAEIVFPLTKINENWVLEFRDSEGIDIEVYSKI